MEPVEKTFASAVSLTLRLPNESAAEIMRQIKALSPEDRAWLKREFALLRSPEFPAGITVTP